MPDVSSERTSDRSAIRCPLHAAAGLRRAGGGAECAECGRRYDIDADIPDLTAGESPASRAEARQWDEQAGRYEAGRARDGVYMAGVRAAVRALRPLPGERILDAGCGTGLTVRSYAGVGADVTALDVSAASLAFLRARVPSGRVRAVRGDIGRLPFADGSFDAVLCANVLQQVEGEGDRRDCVRELARVVRPGGRVVLTAHHYSLPRRWAGWVKEGAAGGHSGAVRHVHRFDVAEFRALLGSELESVRVNGAGFPLPYRFKLSALSRELEWCLRWFPVAIPFATMLVGVGEKAACDGRVKPRAGPRHGPAE